MLGGSDVTISQGELPVIMGIHLKVKASVSKGRLVKKLDIAGLVTDNATTIGKGGSLQMETGKIKWYSTVKGFGFITTKKGDVFLHKSNVPRGMELKEGTQVSFTTEATDRGIKAVNLQLDQ